MRKARFHLRLPGRELPPRRKYFIRTATLTWAVKEHVCNECQFYIQVGTQYWRASDLKICRRHVPEHTWYD